MLFSFYIDFSFVGDAVACGIVEKTTSFEPLSEALSQKYLKPFQASVN